MFRSIVCSVLIMLAICMAGCSQETEKKSHTIDIRARMKDNKIMKLTVKLYFKTPKGIEEIGRHEQEFRYAITLVMARQMSDHFQAKNGGKYKVKSAISSISRQILHEDLKKIKIIHYQII